MNVSREEIMHIANLARLNLSEDEIQKYTNDMDDILNFANIINNADTKNIEESIAAGNNVNVFRKDEIKEFENNEGILINAPEKDRNMFKVPKVVQ